MDKRLNFDSLATIQYIGVAGNTDSCLRALVRLIHFGEEVSSAKLLTFSGSDRDPVGHHCFLIDLSYELIAIKGGFTSGYAGTGPQGLSMALELLESYGIVVDEYLIGQEVFERISASCLLKSDLDKLNSQVNTYLFNKRKYIYKEDAKDWPDISNLKYYFSNEVPLRIIDDRILDLAIQFKQNSDSVIMSGYRRLEDIIRKRTNLAYDHGEKLFSKAFVKDDSVLYWENLHPAENKGRATLFSATYMGYRNRRAHKESGDSMSNDLREFLLLNQLYCLEAAAVERPPNEA